MAFIMYVWPMLQHCSPVWSTVSVSLFNKLFNKLESVQRCFTKRLPGFNLNLVWRSRIALRHVTWPN